MWLGFFLHLATQLVSLRTWSSLPASELAQRLASIAYSAALPLLPTLMPLAYLRHRQPIKLAWRIGFFSFPLLRQARGIQRVLEAAPSPGAAGALLDLAKTAWGALPRPPLGPRLLLAHISRGGPCNPWLRCPRRLTSAARPALATAGGEGPQLRAGFPHPAGCRLLAVAMAPLVMPLPLLPHLAAQLYAVSVVGDNGSLCTAPLLAHPASAARIAALHAAMSFAAAPCTAQPPGTLLAASGQRQQCDAFLAFLRLLLGIVLPTVVVTKAQLLEAVGCKRNWLPDGAAGSERPAALEQALERGVRRLAGRSWLAGPSGSNSGGVDEPDMAADAGSVPSLMPRALLWWLLLCYCWLLSTLLA